MLISCSHWGMYKTDSECTYPCWYNYRTSSAGCTCLKNSTTRVARPVLHGSLIAKMENGDHWSIKQALGAGAGCNAKL